MAKNQKVVKKEVQTNTVVTAPLEAAKAEIAAMPEGTSISQKIRTLAAAGYERGVIAKAIDRRYQHVRNVLETPLKRTGDTTKAE